MSVHIPEPAEIPPSPGRRGGAPGSSLTRFVTLAWVPITTSLMSLVLSVSSIVVATREPEVLMVLPQQVRVAQGEDYGFAYMYVQPALVHTGQNDRVEVIEDMTLTVAGTGGGEPVEFKWDEQAELVYDQGSKSLNYRYAGDAVPLLVSPRNALVPFAVFNGPKGWYFKAGTHRVTLSARRLVSRKTLDGVFEITIAPKDIEFLSSSRGNSFLAFPTRRL